MKPLAAAKPLKLPLMLIQCNILDFILKKTLTSFGTMQVALKRDQQVHWQTSTTIIKKFLLLLNEKINANNPLVF